MLLDFYHAPQKTKKVPAFQNRILLNVTFIYCARPFPQEKTKGEKTNKRS